MGKIQNGGKSSCALKPGLAHKKHLPAVSGEADDSITREQRRKSPESSRSYELVNEDGDTLGQAEDVVNVPAAATGKIAAMR